MASAPSSPLAALPLKLPRCTVLVKKTRQTPHIPPVAALVLQQPVQQAPLQQMLPPLQLVRLSLGVATEQEPVVGLQVPRFWQSFGAGGQTIGLLPTHTPPWHVSVCVQASPSSQVVPSATTSHRPVAALHVRHGGHGAVPEQRVA
jgi:hypothetical protein